MTLRVLCHKEGKKGDPGPPLRSGHVTGTRQADRIVYAWETGFRAVSAGEKVLHRLVRIGLSHHLHLNSLAGQTLRQTGSHATHQQYIHCIQRVRCIRFTVVKRLLLAELQQCG